MVPTEKWTLKVWGAVENAFELTWAEMLALPQVEVFADFHCVTTWSRLDNLWRGVLFKEIARIAEPKPECTVVLQHAFGGYTTNVRLDEMMSDDVLMAHTHDDAPLDIEHGGPMRMIVPRLYAWKGAKWLSGFEFLTDNKRGFWEVHGYHNHADPWTEERYSSQEGKDESREKRREGWDLNRKG
jgi:DMSO/TMAO reductase YedYZ molybdopterin-dependent catalytic subunit